MCTMISVLPINIHTYVSILFIRDKNNKSNNNNKKYAKKYNNE